MPDRAAIDRLDQAVQALLTAESRAVAPRLVDAEEQSLLEVASMLVGLPRPEFRARLRQDLERKSTMATSETETAAIAEPVVTTYLVAENAPALIEFTTQVFGAEEVMRAIGSAGGLHAELRIGDSTLMVGGGAPDLAWRGASRPSALHVYVENTDAVFQRAVQAGATVIAEPRDQEYGERSAGVRDASGTNWYIATAKGPHYIPAGLHAVNVYLHPLRAEPVIAFLTKVFGATGLQKYASPDGVIHHAQITIGASVIEMGEAHGEYQPMPTMFHVHVADVEAAHSRAVQAGATSISAPAAGRAAVRDPFGNDWYLAQR